MNTPSPEYRLMIYFAHSTMVLYGASIATSEQMSITDFLMANAAVCQRVCQEARNLFNYELSDQQLRRAAHVYLITTYSPKNVATTAASKLEA